MYLFFLVYKTSTGEITRKGFMTNDDPVEIQSNATETAMEITEEKYKTLNPTMEYVLNGNIIIRESSPVIQSGPMSFTNIPYTLPAKAYITISPDSTKYEITEDHVDLELTLPGTYNVLFETFPYRDKQFTLEVV